MEHRLKDSVENEVMKTQIRPIEFAHHLEVRGVKLDFTEGRMRIVFDLMGAGVGGQAGHSQLDVTRVGGACRGLSQIQPLGLKFNIPALGYSVLDLDGNTNSMAKD
uniref:Uncharacterized protein n=1 Tax=Micrurus lemniscatus lemniscatus TaxID=129467 RepID=A0A2D4IME0_MICLE